MRKSFQHWKDRCGRGACASLLAIVVAGVPEVGAGAAGLRSSSFLTYGTGGEDTVAAEGRDLEKVSVFAYHLTADGDVLPTSSFVPDATDRLMAGTTDHLVLVTANNRILDEQGRPSNHHGGDATFAFLSDPAKRAEHVRQLVAISEQADGIELNYENFPAEAKPVFTTFVRELRQALAPGKKLSIVLQPKTDDGSGTRGRAVDWRAIEPYADYLRIMAYYYSFSTSPPGPVVPMETLRRLARFALDDPGQSIPRHKVSIILSLWGWDWPLAGEENGRLITHAQAMEIARAHGAVPVRDPQEHSLHFRYVAADGIEHEVWFEDFESIRRRVWLLEAEGLPRVDFWNLNTGDPELWRYVERRTGEARFPGTRFDGGRRTDLAVYRPESRRWFVDFDLTGGTNASVVFGEPGDVPVAADYDGNGIGDFAVFRPASAGWLVDLTGSGGTDLSATYGQAGDVPVPGDYDGDGAADFAVFRPESGRWFVDLTKNGGTDRSVVYGRAGDIPVPLDYDGDGAADFAIFRPSYGGWFVDLTGSGGTNLSAIYGRSGDVPVPGDYDGDGVVDFAVFRPSSGEWWLDTNRNGGTDRRIAYGRPGDIPIRDGGWVADALGVTAR